MSSPEVDALRAQVIAMRRWIAGLSAAVAVLALATIHTIGHAEAQPKPPTPVPVPTPAPPPPTSITFTDGAKRVDIDADGIRIATAAATTIIAADHVGMTSGSSVVELVANATDAHVKALSDLGSSSLVANPKSLCVSIRQIGGKDNHICIPPK